VHEIPTNDKVEGPYQIRLMKDPNPIVKDKMFASGTSRVVEDFWSLCHEHLY